MNGEMLERVSHMKYLGVTLDECLTFDNHISKIHAKAVNQLGILREARHFLDHKTSLLLCQSLILPQLSFCDIVYETTTQSNMKKLQQIQNSALRVILKANKRTSIKSMHDSLKISSLEQRRKLNTAVDCYTHVRVENSSSSHMFVKLTSIRLIEAMSKM